MFPWLTKKNDLCKSLYNQSVEEAIEAAMTLIWNIYDRKAIARALKKGIPAMDYDKED